jgi:hypothetical protein
MMTSRAYSTENAWHVEYEVTGPPEYKEKYAGEVIQIPVRGTAKSTNHKSNVLDLMKQMYPKATTLADIGITKAREPTLLTRTWLIRSANNQVRNQVRLLAVLSDYSDAWQSLS